MWDFPLFPEQASSLARQVDELYMFELGIAGFFTVLDFSVDREFCRRLSPAVAGEPVQSAGCQPVDGSDLDCRAALARTGDVRLGSEAILQGVPASRRCS